MFGHPCHWAMDDYPKIGRSQHPWTDPIHVSNPSIGFPSLQNLLDVVWLWTTIMDELSLIWTPSVAPLSLCRPCHCWLDTWWFFIGWRILQVACQDDLKSNVLDVDIWHNPSSLPVMLFHSSKKLPRGAL